MTTSDFSVRFWGVRGSIACPGPETLRYGGNTPCVEVRCGTDLIIFDAGSGLRPFGEQLAQTRQPIDADIFLSHCHYDHVIGLPFFAPAFAPSSDLRLWAGHMKKPDGLRSAITTLTSYPLFPIGIDDLAARITFHDFDAGETLTPKPGITLRTAPLDHPGGATGYRLEYRGRAIAYLTDNEIKGGGPASDIVALARQADLVIYDCMYTDDEIGAKAGWGHSSWRQGLALAEQAQAKTFCLFHHAPEHDDAFMDNVARQAAAARPGTIVAREGAVIDIAPASA